MKGVRTRFRSCLKTEIDIGSLILKSEGHYVEQQELVSKSSKCIEKLKLYVNKLEIQNSKLASALDDE